MRKADDVAATDANSRTSLAIRHQTDVVLTEARQVVDDLRALTERLEAETEAERRVGDL